MLNRLKEYKEKHGSCKVGNDKEDSRLRNWIASQKAAYTKNALPEDRIAKLEALGFEWGRTYQKSKRSLSPSKDTVPPATKRQKISNTPAKTIEPPAPEAASNTPAKPNEPSVPEVELPPPLAAATLEDPSEPQESPEEEAAATAYV